MINSKPPLTPQQLSSLLPEGTDPKELTQILGRIIQDRKQHNRLKDYAPYAKQLEFHSAGATHRVRALLAANQVGKTLSAGAEMAIHLTGRYPAWWQGRVFNTPISAWASGVTGESTRDNPQKVLYGPLGQPGTGMIPKNAIKDASPRRGLADALDTMLVKWGGGGDVQAGVSDLGFKSNDQGREKWQGPTKHIVWPDEEHDEDVFNEAMTRLNVHQGLMMCTFTPLKGMTTIVRRFLINPPDSWFSVNMTIDDANHYTDEQRAEIIAGYASHEREARAKGIPTMGSGRVFPIEEEFISCEAFEIPSHWPQLGGIDFGWDHPSAGVKLAWDRDADVLYVTHATRAREATPLLFASMVKPWGEWMPWAWPHDGLQHDKGSGIQLAQQYRQQGMRMLPERATFEDGTNGVEAGLMEMYDRMKTGRLKVFKHLNDWFEEFRMYHRKDGLVVKEMDDLMSATRYAVMMKRAAQTRMRKVSRMTHEYQGADAWMG